MKATRLRTEYLENPLGLDCAHPRLMWNCEGGVRQTAYRVVTERWDSGKVAASTMHADYPEVTRERERVTWRVQLWDENDEPGEWSEAFFEAGIWDWDANWITGNYRVNRRKRYPVDCFRKAFSVERPVSSARRWRAAPAW